MNIPNILTGLRFVMIPLYVAVFSFEGTQKIWSVLIFILASATDVLDGYIARKYNMSTRWGQLADPLADKLMQISVILALVINGNLPIWFVVLVALKEILMILGSAFLCSKNTFVKSNVLGKLNTVVLFLVLCAFHVFPSMPPAFATSLLVVSLLLSLSAMVHYAYYYLSQAKNKQE